MSILGSLIISLEAQTASFIDGMTGASKTARTVGNDIETSFSRIGQVAQTALAPLGDFGRFLGETFSGIGSSAGIAIRAMGSLSGGASALGLGLGATAGSMAAVTLGSVALVTHTAESIAKMGELAQSAGLSVQTLSGLSFVFKQTGVDTETGVKSIEKFDKAILKAATSAPGTVNAFTRLGVAVLDVGGKQRSTEAIFLDVAEALSKLETGWVKTGLAQELFGKGGAVLIPALNRGRDGIKELINTATELGIVLDDKTASAAIRFKEDLGIIESAGQGASIRLTKDLLPALDFVASKFVESFKTGQAQAFIDKIAAIVVATIALGEGFYSGFKQWVVGGELFQSVASKIIEGLSLIKEAADSPWKVFSSSFREHVANFNFSNGLQDAFGKFRNDSKQIWADNQDFLNGLTSTTLPAGPRIGGSSSGGANIEPKKNTVLERVQDRIDALQKEIVDWHAVGAAGSQAEALIAEATQKGNELFGKLSDEADKDKTGISKQFVLANESMIRLAGSAEVLDKMMKSLTTDIDKQSLKLDEQDRAAVALSDAYRQGGSAIASAAIGKQFAEQAAKLAVLSQMHDYYVTHLGGTSIQAVITGAKVSELTAKLQANEEEARKLAADDLTGQLEKQSYNFSALAPLVANLSNAYLLNEDAVRRNRIELELYKFVLEEQEKGIELTGTMIDSKRKQLEDADKQAYDGALKQEAARYSLLVLYDQEIERLNRVREVIQQSGQSTLLIDAQLLDAQNRLVQQWDQAAFKAGTFGERVKGVFNELIIQGKLAGEAISHAVLTAFDGAEGQLAHLIVTGKANFLGVLQSLEESVVKAGIQKALAATVGGIPGLSNIGKLLGGGQQLGTEQNPMIVRFQNGFLGGIGGGSSALPFSAGGAPTAIPGVVGAVGGESLGLPTGLFTQQLNTMAAAQAVFAGKMGGSWTGIVGMFRGAIGLMASLFHIHTASMIAGQAAQTGAAVASQTAQTAAASAGAGARSNIGFMEHMKKIFHHASDAAAGAYSSVFDSGIPFPLNVILAPIAAAGAFAGVLAWGAIGSAARGALVPEDMLMMTHKNEMVIPGDISEGLQGIIRANQGGFAPSVSDFGGAQKGGRGDEFHAHVHMGDVNAWDAATGADQLKRLGPQMGKQIKQMFKTGYLNPRKLARV